VGTAYDHQTSSPRLPRVEDVCRHDCDSDAVRLRRRTSLSYPNHGAILAGAYDVVNGTTVASMPAAVPGMKLKSQGFRLWLDEARAIIDSGVAGSITQAGLFTGGPSDNFVTYGVQPGDTIKLTSSITVAGVATVAFGTNAFLINLASLPVGFVPTNEFAVGDAITLATPAYSGKITAVTNTTITVDTAFTANAAAAAISVVRVRLLRNATQTYAVKAIAVDGNNAPIVNQLQLTTNFPFTAASGVSYEVTRRLTQAEITSGFTLSTVTGILQVAPAAEVLVGTMLRNLTDYSTLLGLAALADAPQMYLEYKALDVSFANIPAPIQKNADVGLLLGVTDLRNPLGQGAVVMYGNAQATIYAVGIASEDDAGFLGAIDVINRNHFYAQAILTQEAALLAAFNANAIAQAAPEKANYGLAIGNVPLPTTITLASGTAGQTQVDPSTSIIDFFQDGAGAFENPALTVLPGDLLTISSASYVINQVVNNNRLQVVSTTPFPSSTTGLTYTITRALSKDQQAASIASTATALGSKRTIVTWSDSVSIGGVQAPGYYLSCVLAGMIVGLPSQAGLTNKGIAVVEKVYHTNWDYFSDTQLDTIATGGVTVFVQDDANSLPYVRMQLTTDQSTLETGQISAVKNNDYLSLFFKGIIKPYLGTWNVTPELIGALGTAIQQGITFQLNNRVAKIGAPLLAANIETLAQSTISPDRVEIFLGTKQPVPLNTVGLHMII